MDRATYEKLDNLLVKDGSLTIAQFQELLSQELGAEAALVRQLEHWESTGYDPGQLFSLKSVLRDLVTTKTPSFSTMEDTMKISEDDTNGKKLLRDIVFDLLATQRLDKWVTEYATYYVRAMNTD